MRFLGSIGGDVTTLVHGARAPSAADGRWQVESKIFVNLPSTNNEEKDVELPLDAVLPRVLELATTPIVCPHPQPPVQPRA